MFVLENLKEQFLTGHDGTKKLFFTFLITLHIHTTTHELFLMNSDKLSKVEHNFYINTR